MSFSPDSIFLQAAEQGASDVHLQVNSLVIFRVNGALVEASDEIVTADLMDKILQIILADQYERFNKELEMDVSYSVGDQLRLRVNCHFETGHPGLVARLIPGEVPTMQETALEWLEDTFVSLTDGLILFTGPTGSGKSTSMAAVIDVIRKRRNVHIVTLEDPVEFIFDREATGIVRQRELGDDFHTFPEAMRRILRQDPDVVMLGEMRDLETIAAAMTLAETGHLVLGTLHTPNSVQTIDRIIDVFPPHQQGQVRSQLSFSLKMVIAQKLLPKVGGGLFPMREILLNTGAVANIIRENRVHELYSVIQMGGEQGMVTFDKDAKRLFTQGLISEETYNKTVGFINAANEMGKK